MRKGKSEYPRQKNGFTLVELMIVLAVIAILVAILIPNLLDALDRAKQRATVGEIRSWGNALGAYMTEIGTVPAGTAPASVNASTIHSQLVPYAIGALHDTDSWKNNLFYYADAILPNNYTVRSGGKNGVVDFCVGPGSWFNYDEDIALNDGLFICSPS